MKISNINKLSKASKLSLLAIVILVGAIFITVNSALETQTRTSNAAENTTFQYGNSYCTGLFPFFNCVIPTLNPAPTSTPIQQPTKCIIRPTCQVGSVCPQYIGVGYCNPTSTPVSVAPTCAPPPQCYKGKVLICLVPYGGWCKVTPPPVPVATAIPSIQPPTSQPSSEPTSMILPTATSAPSNNPVPGDTVLALTVGLDGIGMAGDRVSPGTAGNMNPLHPTRTITMTIFNSQNQQVVSQQGTITYNTTTGLFDGTVDLGSQFTTGDYTVKIQTAQYLRGLVPGIQTITAGQTNTLPYLALIAGDINGDNQINILDYNILMGCYSDLLPAANCTPQNNVLSDLNDDGNVNQFDYNLFLRELSNVGGD